MGARGAMPKVRTSPHAPLFFGLVSYLLVSACDTHTSLVGYYFAASITTCMCVESLDILECSCISIVGCRAGVHFVLGIQFLACSVFVMVVLP